MPPKPWALAVSPGSVLAGHVSTGTPGASAVFLLRSCRVRSIIMLQEKAQDRERLLLKFIKIMKVTLAPSWASPQAVGGPGLRPGSHGRRASLCSICGS